MSYYIYLNKRFYTPPSRRTWSKQNPKFLTPRPLVHPFNLSRLHPEKEWWKMSDRKLHPVTYMGHPDPSVNERIGGSIYAEQMDSATLVVIMHRCISKAIYSCYIWDKLIGQAKKLCIGLDHVALSYIYLYASKSGVSDRHLIGSFLGRIIAKLQEFSLLSCANVIKAMHNSKYFHQSTFDRVIKQVKNILYAKKDIYLTESLACLAAIHPFTTAHEVDTELLSLLFDEIHVHNVDMIDKSLLLAVMESCFQIGLRTRYIHNYCMLPLKKMVDLLKNNDFIANVALYTHLAKSNYMFGLTTLGDNLFKHLEDNCYLLNIDEVSLFLWYTQWDKAAPGSLKKVLLDRFTSLYKDGISDQSLILAFIGGAPIPADRIAGLNIESLGTWHRLLLLRHIARQGLDIKIPQLKPILPWHVCSMIEVLGNIPESREIDLLKSPSHNLTHQDLVSLLSGYNGKSKYMNKQIQSLITDMLNGSLEPIKCSHTLLVLALKFVDSNDDALRIFDKLCSMKWDTDLESFDSFSIYKPLLLEMLGKFGIRCSKALKDKNLI